MAEPKGNADWGQPRCNLFAIYKKFSTQKNNCQACMKDNEEYKRGERDQDPSNWHLIVISN